MTLTSLAQMLRVGPPRLSSLMGMLNGAEGRADFAELVATYLPDHMGTLMSLSPFDGVAQFLEYFSNEYFPVEEIYAEQGYQDLLYFIPLLRLGIGWDDYHDFDDQYRPGIHLMMAFIANPYMDFDQGVGPRVPILERAAELAGIDRARRIPEKGLNPHELHQLLNGTPYEGVALLADILYQDTDNTFLNINSGMEIDDAEWDPALVAQLTSEWPEAERAWGVINRTAVRFEQSFETETEDLLKIVEAKDQEQGPAPNTPLWEVFAGEDHEEAVLQDLEARREIRHIAEEEGYYPGIRGLRRQYGQHDTH